MGEGICLAPAVSSNCSKLTEKGALANPTACSWMDAMFFPICSDFMVFLSAQWRPLFLFLILWASGGVCVQGHIRFLFIFCDFDKWLCLFTGVCVAIPQIV